MAVVPSVDTVPLVPCVVAVTVSVCGGLSGSVSLASTAMVTGVPLGVVAESFTASGGWLHAALFAASTVTVLNSELVTPSESVTRRPMSYVPGAIAPKIDVTLTEAVLAPADKKLIGATKSQLKAIAEPSSGSLEAEPLTIIVVPWQNVYGPPVSALGCTLVSTCVTGHDAVSLRPFESVTVKVAL